MVLFLIASKAKNMPTRKAGKLLNLGARDGLWRGNDALMRALPRFGAHCQRTEHQMFSDPSGSVCAGGHGECCGHSAEARDRNVETSLAGLC